MNSLLKMVSLLWRIIIDILEKLVMLTIFLVFFGMAVTGSVIGFFPEWGMGESGVDWSKFSFLFTIVVVFGFCFVQGGLIHDRLQANIKQPFVIKLGLASVIFLLLLAISSIGPAFGIGMADKWGTDIFWQKFWSAVSFLTVLIGFIPFFWGIIKQKPLLTPS